MWKVELIGETVLTFVVKFLPDSLDWSGMAALHLQHLKYCSHLGKTEDVSQRKHIPTAVRKSL